MTLSESKINDKVKETKAEKDFKYKKLKHNAADLDCLHCKYDESEKSLKDKIKEMTDTTTRKDKDGNDVTIQKLKVQRGKHDDVIGWFTEWQ